MRSDAYEAVALIRKEPVKPIYLLAGPGDFPYEAMVRMIAARVTGRKIGLRDMDSADLSNVALVDALDGASNLSLFGESQVILLRSPQAMGDADLKRLAAYINGPEPPTVLIILFTYDRENEQGYRPPAPRAALAELAEKKGIFVDLTFSTSRKKGGEEERLLRPVADRGRKAGKRFSRAAAAMLVEISGGSAGLLFSETDKAMAFAGSRDEVSPDDVRAVGSRNPEADIFEMIDLLASGERSRALKAFCRLWEAVSMPDSGKAIYITTMLARHFRFILQGTAGKSAAGISLSDRKSSLTAQPPFVQRKIMAQARRFSMRRAANIMTRLHQLDRGLKSGEAIDDRQALEGLLIEITA